MQFNKFVNPCQFYVKVCLTTCTLKSVKSSFDTKNVTTPHSAARAPCSSRVYFGTTTPTSLKINVFKSSCLHLNVHDSISTR